MKLIVGLGNPEPKYSGTRHNIGFAVVNNLANQHQIKITKKEKQALVGSYHQQGEKVILAKPQTYMNSSGQAVVKLADWYNISPSDIIIIYDDLDLEVGRLKLKAQGSHGGHNGIKSVINQLGTQQVPRLRVGIGRPPEYLSVSDYVLGQFSSQEEVEIEEVINQATSALEVWLTTGITAAMNQYN
ncbi:MAG: aminoacyl-tRNA hydrolase [Bacillota bacterium]